MRKERPWPMTLPACLKCGISRDEGSYLSRGLCVPCYGRERRAGTTSDWPNHSATAFRGSNPTLQACMLIGATTVSERLEVPKETVMRWAREGTPKRMATRVSKLTEELLSLECESAERAELFGEEETHRQDPWATKYPNVFPGWDCLE